MQGFRYHLLLFTDGTERYRHGEKFFMKKIITMREMADNQTGVIKKIKSGGELARRIREMGIIPGAEIMIIGRAPLKDPVAIKVKDFTLTLRNNEADFILVEIDTRQQS
jgi:ferrous iron transport protein A